MTAKKKMAALDVLASAATLTLLAAFFSVAALSQPTTSGRAARQTPPKVLDGTAILVKHYDSRQMLRLAFVLTPPHMDEERALIEALHDKKSPLFHQFLTAEQFNRRFAPSEEDEEAVVAWAQSQSLTITRRYNNRLVVDVEAPAGVIEKALNVTLNNYQLDAETFFSNDRDPMLPSALGSVVHMIEGLNSLERARPVSNNGTPVTRPDYVPGPVVGVEETHGVNATAALSARSTRADIAKPTPDLVNGSFDPQDLYSSQGYNYGALQNLGHCCNPLGNPGSTPPETSIAIAAFGDVSFSDLLAYQTEFPYLSYLVAKIFVDGGYTCNNSAGPDSNCVETTVDTEFSLATSNSFASNANTAEIFVYESSGNASDLYNAIVDQGKARIFSTSFGWPEGINISDSQMQGFENIFASYVIRGWTLLAATGDNGATAGCKDQLAVEYPASDPYMVAAGGTTLRFNSNDTYDYEYAWTGGTLAGQCASKHGGGTGGVSSYFPSPAYQAGLGVNFRAVPDIALNAGGPQVVIYDGQPGGYATGTSMVAPELAGFFAQENAYLLSIGNACGGSGTAACAPLGWVTPLLYAKDINTAPHYPYYDITFGCNSNDITIQYGLNPYCAETGFDLVTGWGSANMLQLAWAFNWSLAGTKAAPTVSFSGPPTNKWYNTNQSVSWKVVDTTSGGLPGTGIAGFTQGWDTLPSDAPREATPGSDNTFYSGPEFPNATLGCLSLASGGSCSGGVSQGCHSAYVRAWNNMGVTSGDAYYGYVCYDTVAPTVSASKSPAPNSAGWNNTPVTITFTATDPGGADASGIKATYYGFDATKCSPTALGSCQTYSAPFSYNTQGYNLGVFFTEDNAGNQSSPLLIGVNIDETAPVTQAGLGGTVTAHGVDTPVQVTLTATDSLSGVASTSFSLNGRAYSTYTGPFTVTAAGAYTLKFFSVDVAGNVEATNTATFSIVSPTTITLTVSPNPADVAQTVTLKATVAASLLGTPTGTVTFKEGTTIIGTATLTSGAASITTTSLPFGADSLTASYGGATYFLASTSAAVSEDIKQTTTTKVTSAANPSTYEQPVTFTAVVTPASSGTPTGSVEFLDGTTVFAIVALSGGKATFAITTLSVATHSITAVYEGNSAYVGSVRHPDCRKGGNHDDHC
jgi:hypothetical protein